MIDVELFASDVMYSPKSAIKLLKDNTQLIHFFGLGFIQIKLNDTQRVHFYHSAIPPFVEEPHNHRYNFISHVLKGRMTNTLYERAEGAGTMQKGVLDVTCKKDDMTSITDDALVGFERVGQIVTAAGSSYYLNSETFHTVKTSSKCITFIERGIPKKQHAQVIRTIADEDRLCPFSRPMAEDAMWDIVRDCIECNNAWELW